MCLFTCVCASTCACVGVGVAFAFAVAVVVCVSLCQPRTVKSFMLLPTQPTVPPTWPTVPPARPTMTTVPALTSLRADFANIYAWLDVGFIRKPPNAFAIAVGFASDATAAATSSSSCTWQNGRAY